MTLNNCLCSGAEDVFVATMRRGVCGKPTTWTNHNCTLTEGHFGACVFIDPSELETDDDAPSVDWRERAEVAEAKVDMMESLLKDADKEIARLKRESLGAFAKGLRLGLEE